MNFLVDGVKVGEGLRLESAASVQLVIVGLEHDKTTAFLRVLSCCAHGPATCVQTSRCQDVVML